MKAHDFSDKIPSCKKTIITYRHDRERAF